MSFMPDIGTPVRLTDGRLALVESVTPDGQGNFVRLMNGVLEQVTCEDIALACEPSSDAYEDMLAFLRDAESQIGEIVATPNLPGALFDRAAKWMGDARAWLRKLDRMDRGQPTAYSPTDPSKSP